MRLRLGLLRDTASIEREAAREAAKAEARKHKSSVPTVKTESQAKAEEASTTKAKEKAIEEVKSRPLPRIRPLSETKAIDTGATFISETFLFMVAGGLIVFESWRSRRKETTRQEDVKDRLKELEQSEQNTRAALVALEKELLELKSDSGKALLLQTERLLPREIWEGKRKDQSETQHDGGLFTKLTSWGWSFIKKEVNSEPKESESRTDKPQQPTTPEQHPLGSTMPSSR